MSIDAYAAAKESGATFYNTGAPCKHGHFSDRYTKSKACVECHRLAMAATKEKYRERDAEKAAKRAAEREAERERLRPEREEARRAYRARWKRENAERVKAVNDAWRALNADRQKATTAKWRKEHPERVRQYTAEWAKRNPEKERARWARRYAADPDGARRKFLEWHARNPDARRRYNNSYKARKLQSGGRLSRDIVQRLFVLQKGKCACCRKPLGKDFHLDHIVALVNGGSNTDDNVQLLRKECNLKKNKKDPIDFMQSRGFLL